MKKIKWENWNEIEDELCRKSLKVMDRGYDGDDNEEEELYLPTIITPFGEYRSDSIFRPACRWECWIGYSNFHIEEEHVKLLDGQIPGIEALSMMGAYTFCVGVAKMFNWSDVRKNIEKELNRELYVSELDLGTGVEE